MQKAHLDLLELSVVSLNLGGRNLNPLEFIHQGDETRFGKRATEVHTRAEAVMLDDGAGPLSMTADEKSCVRAIIDALKSAVTQQGPA